MLRILLKILAFAAWAGLALFGALICAGLGGGIEISSNYLGSLSVAGFAPSLLGSQQGSLYVTLILYFGVCVLFWHLLVFFAIPRIPYKFGSPRIGLEELFLIGSDYLWVLIAVSVAIFSVSDFLVSRLSSELDRLQARLVEANKRFSEATASIVTSCDIVNVELGNDIRARDRSTLAYVDEICQEITADPSLLPWIYDSNVSSDCMGAGFRYSDSNDGPYIFLEPQKLSIDSINKSRAAYEFCSSSDEIKSLEREIRHLDISAASFVDPPSKDSPLWFIFLLIAASLRLTRTSREIARL